MCSDNKAYTYMVNEDKFLITSVDANNIVYTMTCPEGGYQARSWLGLGWAVLTHRLWHLWHDRRWMD